MPTKVWKLLVSTSLHQRWGRGRAAPAALVPLHLWPAGQVSGVDPRDEQNPLPEK